MLLAGEIEMDESYFGGRRKGKRGRGAVGKVPVFGLLKRGGEVYAKVITDTRGKSPDGYYAEADCSGQHCVHGCLPFI